MRRLRSLLLVVLAVMLALSGCGPSSCSEDDGGGDGGEAEGTLTLEVGESAEFDYAGETHTAELVRVVGSSAEFVISSSPTSYVLTEGVSAEADLNADSLPDATLEVTEVSDAGATLSVNALGHPAYDETDFETQGGLAPYKVTGIQNADPALVTLDDGSYLLFYARGTAHQVQWEHYLADGTQVLAPQLGAGRTRWVPAGTWESYDPMDVVRVDDAIYESFRSNSAVYITRFGLDMQPEGVPTYLTPHGDTCALATDGERIWMATQETSPQSLGTQTGPRPAVAIMEIAPGTPPMRVRSSVITDPPEKVSDGSFDLAFDADTGLLAVSYIRFFAASNEYESRFAIIDPDTMGVTRDVLLAGNEEFGGATPSALGIVAEGGRVLVYWETADALNQRISLVDLRTGEVTDTWASRSSEGMPALTAELRDLELVQLESGPAILFVDKTRHQELGGTPAEQARFVLQPISEDGPAGDPIVLDGGQPILADVTFDLASLKSNPKKAVCGSPCLLTGAVVNRGSQDAKSITLEVAVDGEAIGTLDIGTIKTGETSTFAKVWDVPADLTAETVDISYALTTTSEQYTADNDTAASIVQVIQKGVVQGRVSNASGMADLGWWTGGLAGVEVSFGGRTVLTDASGCFVIEEVEFGSGTITATKEGFNPASTTVETTRTKPIASVGIRLDNHGTLRVHVTDEAGVALSGVQTYLVGYDRSDITDENGDLVLEMPYGTYRIAFKKGGYQGLAPVDFEVRLGEETAGTVTMKEATTAQLTGRVIDRLGTGVAGAPVTIANNKGETVASLTTDAEGHFDAGELTVKPSGAYVITATGAGLTVTEPIALSGGELASVMIELVPDRGELAQRDATEGYTSWMLKASWPGFLDVGGQSIYVWYGNYAVRVGAQYWDGSRDLNRVQVTTWGGTYETHVTKGEIEFPVSGDDLTGHSGKKLPTAMAKTTDAPSQAWWKSALKTAVSVYKEYDPVINLGKSIYSGIQDVKEAFSDEDQWLVLGQGAEVLTWKESLDDFQVVDDWDWNHPYDSASSVVKAIPTSFAIPIVIGGSSVQDTAVRCDGIDVVDKTTGEVYYTNRAQWFSYTDDAEANTSIRTFDIDRLGVPVGDVRIFVWVKTQKYWNDAPGGTCFDQREQQVIIYDPGTGGQKAFIAPGDMYLEPGRWTTEDIARLTN
ncbi:MAG: carboxypeptidase-like regulatory domain-containing protein [Coriobacteriia bacterium]|nr:carboxypeptidase-like regulatory domain-containing protein [Coriobacteriia bacterium]